jgi:acyl carrier protein
MKILSTILRFFLSLRYKVTVTGSEVLKGNHSKLILPNHQALVDPQIAFTQIYRFSKVVPVVSEMYFHKPVLKNIFKAIGAVPVSDLSLDNRDQNTLKSMSASITDALQKGKNVLLYPSGQIAGQGYERLLNKQSAWAVVNELPVNTQVIGVRISGLWGSMWSRAWIGKAPDFVKTALKAIWFLVANLFFFMPRREVTIEFRDITSEALKNVSKGKTGFNTFLETFYNADGEEKVNFLKHYFYGPALKRALPERIEGSVADLKTTVTFSEEEIPEDVLKEVIRILVTEAHLDEKGIKLNSNLNLDLNIDSLGLVAVITAIEEKFKRSADVEITYIKTVADLCFIAMNRKLDNEALKPSTLNQWTEPLHRIVVEPAWTVPALFIKSFRKNNEETFAYDKMLGTTTRKDFLLKAYVVSKILKAEVDGKYVGIMLPALQSTTLLVAATYLAGKIPVMLNWTVGAKVMEHCIAHVNLKKVITAKSFYDRVSDVLPSSVKEKCVFFEEKVKSASLSTKMAGLLSCYLGLAPSTHPEDVAVVLFTSGSEALPKAVELTHKNLLSDLYGSFSHVEIKSDYIFLSFLPPFHSFGFTILTILPLVSGLKIAYTPDPTDSREVLKILLHTHANAILGTPTFLKMLLSIATGNDLKHVRLAISGAESLHPSVLETFLQKTGGKATLLEGYGITECSPVLVINPKELQKINSVGTFIKGVDYLITDINTYESLPQGKEGMIMVKGNNIFNGYADKSLESPFVEIGGVSYYKTGDLGHVDADGYLFITGRLKRFIKIAGEMISLPAVENALVQKYGDPEKTVLAIEGNDKMDPPRIVLFSVLPIDLSEANALLKQSGFSNLVKLHSVVKVDEIPLLGTGKTDYKVLKNMINDI